MPPENAAGVPDLASQLSRKNRLVRRTARLSGAGMPVALHPGMTRFLRRRRASGFTIIEAVLVVAIVGIAAALLIPAMGEMIRVTKMTGVTRENATLLRKCRYEAIKRGVPCRVRLDPATTSELFAFADVHGAALTDPPDGLFNDIAGQPRGATDYEVHRQRLPAGIAFEFAAVTGLASVDGFTGATKDAVFQPDGSIDDPGAFRF